jgi:CBS domain-containing protein
MKIHDRLGDLFHWGNDDNIQFMNIIPLLTPKKEVEYLYGDFSVRQALEKMDFHRFGTVPVIDRNNGHYLCSLSEGDFLWYWKEHGFPFETFGKLPLTSIKPSRDIQSVGVNCQIKEVYPLVTRQNFVPVVDDQNVFIGIIRRQSVVNALLSEKNK